MKKTMSNQKLLLAHAKTNDDDIDLNVVGS